MPRDVSTAILIDEIGAHSHSTAVLRLGLHMGSAYAILSRLALLLVPRVIRDTAYSMFARNRGRIWKTVKKVTGMGDTVLEKYQDRIVGLDEPVDPSWGFDPLATKATPPS